MPLIPPAHIKTKEAWYAYGPIAAGKSTIWDSVAKAYRENGNEGRFHVISTEPERAYVTVERHVDWSDNVSIYEPERTYEGLLATCKAVHAVATKDDWIVLDSIGACQEWVRNSWFERPENFGKSWRDFQAGGGNVKEVQSHSWISMSETYKQWMIEYVLGFPGHRMAVAQSQPVAEGVWDQGHVRDTYGHIGFKPVGYKFDDYYFHSLWFANRTRDNKLTLKTVKDKPGRRWLDGESIADLDVGGFVLSYLQVIAGWTVE